MLGERQGVEHEPKLPQDTGPNRGGLLGSKTRAPTWSSTPLPSCTERGMDESLTPLEGLYKKGIYDK
jgi:hypothetical protein